MWSFQYKFILHVENETAESSKKKPDDFVSPGFLMKSH
jgi:hypothetical protein